VDDIPDANYWMMALFRRESIQKKAIVNQVIILHRVARWLD